MSSATTPQPRVEFYILSTDQEARRLEYVCRLTEKAYHLGHSLYLHCPPDQLAHLDELLWTFKQGSFVPHALYDEADSGRCPVWLGAGQQPPPVQVLIQLADAVPPFFQRFERVVEVVTQASEVKARARARFRHYRSYGIEPLSHQIAAE